MSAPLAEMPPAQRHAVIAEGFAEQIAAVDDWDAPTPVAGWVARDVVSHLIDWFPGFLSAGGVHLPGVPDVADDPAAAWDARRRDIATLLDGPAAGEAFTHPMIGEFRLADAIDMFYTADVFMHTWDLSAAAGRDAHLDPEFAAQLHAGMRGMEEVLRSSGQYGPAVPVPADADPVTALIGFIGRDPAWAPTATI
ncbi:TIGR03086 family metal-binding protein [Gordonia sp. DT30]|uniref:TIGR03086 family metal-binding protein n=1 Tax=unclassified Gordonia (in: high G+C Gram-positive bacteria) TaxID=2657482 RepID=UPI003CF0C88C